MAAIRLPIRLLLGASAMNRRLLLSSLSFAAIAAMVATAWGIEVGEYVLESQAVIQEWQRSYRFLGNPMENEHGVTASSGNRGTKVRCASGIICMKYGPSAKAYHVRGGIFSLYKNLGGPQGQLGFPIGNEFAFNAQGHDAQRFERGTIHWSASQGRFIVGPLPGGAGRGPHAETKGTRLPTPVR
jgi:uncharacterized protein with LGFP repeats